MARVTNRKVVEFPRYGYFEGFDLRLLVPQPNMDMAFESPWLALVDLIGPDGSHPDFEVIGMFRSVHTGEL